MRANDVRTLRSRGATALAAALVVAATLALSGCLPAAPASDGRLPVVAAEDMWGSIASQLGGDRVRVTDIISNPNTDPHEYEPTVADARAIADSRLVIVNGAGYDAWAAKLVAADPRAGRTLLDVAALERVPAGGNPHLWYAPSVVRDVVARISADLTRLDPAGAAYYAGQRGAFETTALADYGRLVSTIRATYAGTPIAGSESIVAPLAEGLGLDLVTPPAFLNAISEGTGPSAADKTTVDTQIRTGAAKVLIVNRQNSTPDVTALVAVARAAHVPVVYVTETIPAGETFQGWQTAQLRALAAALHEATGR